VPASSMAAAAGGMAVLPLMLVERGARRSQCRLSTSSMASQEEYVPSVVSRPVSSHVAVRVLEPPSRV
jgi:hypothetical protein